MAILHQGKNKFKIKLKTMIKTASTMVILMYECLFAAKLNFVIICLGFVFEEMELK